MNRIIHVIGEGCIFPFMLLVHYTLTHYGMFTAGAVFLVYQLRIRWSVSVLCNYFFLGIVLILIFRCQLLVAVIIIFKLKLIIREI